MSDFIPSILVPAGVNDQRDRDFVAAFSAMLQEFRPSALVIQDAFTAPASLLPIMILEAGLTDYVPADIREDLLRTMIAAAPEIHAMTGTVKGVRRALETLGISARWTQWYQERPKAAHDTHKVVLFLNDTVISGHAPLDLPNQRAAARVIAAAKRHSQDVAVQYGIRGETILGSGAASRRGRTVRIMAPRLEDASYQISTFAGTGAYALRTIRINAKAA